MARNRDYYGQWVCASDDLDAYQVALLYDPQTSGGLLMAVAPERADALLNDLQDAGEMAFEIGEVVDGDGRITVRN